MKKEELLERLKNNQIQYRAMELRAESSEEENEDEFFVEGYASTFNEPYPLYRYVDDDGYTILLKEEVDRNAFDEANMEDVIFQYNHEGRVYARKSNGTLEISPDDHGLYTKANLGGTEIGRQLYQEIKDGYTTKMSFGFTIDHATEFREVEDSEEADEVYVYTIDKIGRLYDVSAVSLPANEYTEISAQRTADGVIGSLVTERLQRRHEEKAKAEQRQRILEMIERSQNEN